MTTETDKPHAFANRSAYEVGQEIYIAERCGWHAHRYRLCKISGITPSGRIKARVNDAEWIFDADGRERGKRYNGCWIDSEMSLPERAVWVKKENAKREAVSILRKLDLNPKAENAEYLKSFIAEVYGKLEEANKLLETVWTKRNQ